MSAALDFGERLGGDSLDTRLLLAAMALNSLPLGFTVVVLPIYLSDAGFSAEVIGGITSASSIANTVSLVPFAIAADRYGRKVFVISGFAISAVAYVLFSFTRDLNLILLASVIGGVGLAGGLSAAIWTPAWTALLAEKAGSDWRTSAFAWSQGMWTIALSTGSMLSLLPTLLQTSFKISIEASLQYSFIFFAVVAIVSAAVILPVSQHHRSLLPAQKEHSYQWLPKRSITHISKFSAQLGLVGFAAGISVQLLSLWFNKMYAVDANSIGPWFAAAEITSLVVVPVISVLTRALGSPKCVLTTQGLSALFLILMVLAPTYQAAGFLYIIRNFFMNISWAVEQSYLMGTVRAEERAFASAITSTIWGMGNSISPLAAGVFLNSQNYLSISAPLIIGGAVYMIAAVAFYNFFRRTRPVEERHAHF